MRSVDIGGIVNHHSFNYILTDSGIVPVLNID